VTRSLIDATVVIAAADDDDFDGIQRLNTAVNPYS
jgi:hypothetical protein